MPAFDPSSDDRTRFPGPHGHSFPRPSSQTVDAHVEALDDTCPECGDQSVAKYRVLSEGGWWDVVKCRSCLTSISRARGPLLGSFEPLSDHRAHLAQGEEH